MASNEPAYKAISREATQRRDESIPREYHLSSSNLSNLPQNLTDVVSGGSNIFNPTELSLYSQPVKTILASIRDGERTSEEVTRAFCKSAAVAHQLTNCLTVALFDSAIRRAKELDDHLKRIGSVVGPLHGLPISLKDCFITPPVPSAIGMAAYANTETKSEEESVLVTLLKDAGAVIHCKTNVPVAMMMMETDNNVYGPTLNPFNTGCSAGGSSGGESALLAMHGSPIGVGTDIGGSIRIPSSFCGLYGLKPSFSRLPTYGARSGIPGNEFIFSVNGPMAVDIDDLETYCEALLSPHAGLEPPWRRDPKCIPLPWRPEMCEEISGKKLKLGIMPPHDGVVHAHPPVAGALELVRAACQSAGHEIIDWEPEGHGKLFASVQSGFLGLGGPPISQKLAEAEEPFFPGMAGYKEAAERDRDARRSGSVDGILTAEQLRDMNLTRNAMQKTHLDRWRNAGIDALIAPVSPWSAVRKGFTSHGPGLPYYGFTAVFSLLDVPACTIPVLKVHAEEDMSRGAHSKKPVPFNELDKSIMEDWDPEFYHQTPVGLQVVGERLGEEKVLGITRVLRDLLLKHNKEGDE